MPVISKVESSKQKDKPLGVHLVEAGLINPAQIDMALKDQKVSGRRLGKILADRGWVAQQTIEYFIEKVVLPERRTIQKQLSHPKKNGSHNLTIVDQASQVERENSDSLMLSAIPSRELKVNLSSRRTIQFLFLVVLGLTLASLFGHFSLYFLPDYPLRNTFAPLFNVDAEQTIPTLYSASALLFSSILLAIIAYAKKITGDRYVRHWGALSIIFLYLSVDEIISIHERTLEPLRSALDARGFLYQAWVIPGAALVLIVLLAFLRFLADLPAKTRHLFLIAGTIYVGGTIGMEIVGAPYWDSYGSGPNNMTYAMIATLEEFLEMLGIVVFIYALLSYISSYMKGVSLRVNIIDDRKQRRSA